MPSFLDYDMITDTIDWLGQSIQYKFVVRLANKNKDGNRESFHKEYTYNASYNDVESLCSIKRSFDYYLLLESVNKSNGVYVQIRPYNMIMFHTVLSQIFNLLFDDKLWAIKNKKLIIKGKPDPIVLSNLPMGKWMSFELIVIEYNDTFDKGVRISFSDNSQYTDVRIDQFMGFMYFMNTFNMYQAALSIINYLQRPPYGTNMVVFDNYQRGIDSNYEGEVYAKGNRTIESPKQKRSFFDKINKISE